VGWIGKTSRGAVGCVGAFEVRHEQGLWAASQHPEMWTWTIPRGKSPEHFQTWFQAGLEACKAGEECVFATIGRASGRPIGATGFHALRPEHRGLEIGGTWLEPAAWGTGANIEAKLLMLEQHHRRGLARSSRQPGMPTRRGTRMTEIAFRYATL
jgi:RimJ/RimL family protein N-acetyltransferase